MSSDLPPDVEGLAIADGHRFASAQNVESPDKNRIDVYGLAAPHELVKSVRVVSGVASDDCDRTDGIAAYGGYLGSVFPEGLLVCQDGNNGSPGSDGNQKPMLVRSDQLLSAS